MANNEKLNISYTIRAVDKFSRVHDKLERQFDSLQRSAAQMEAIDPDIHVSASTEGAEDDLSDVNRKARAIPNFVPIRIQTFGGGSFRQLANRLETVSTISRSMVMGGIFTALPMLSPILASTAGGAGALASALTSAGVGAAGFAAVAIPALTGIFDANEKVQAAQEAVANAEGPEEKAAALEKLEGIYDSLSGAQTKTLNKMQDFSSFYSDFAKQFEQPILDTFRGSMDAARTLLEELEPAIQDVSNRVSSLMDAFNRNLKTDDMQAFFDWVNSTAAPYLEELTKGVGNFLMGFGNMMVAFNPLADSFMDGFLNMSEKFREWSSTLENNEAFQNFISYVQEQGPKVLELFGNLVQFLVAFGQAMAPLGELILEFANHFLRLGTELLQNNKFISTLVGLIPVVVGVFKLFAPVIKLVGMLISKLGPVVSWIITTFSRWAPWIMRVASMLIRFSNPIGWVINGVILLGTIVVTQWDKITKWTSNLVSNVKKWFRNMRDKVVSTITDLTVKAVNKFIELKDKAIEKAGDLLAGVKRKFNEIRTAIANKVQAAKDAVSEKFEDIKSAVSEKMGDVKSSIEELWGEAVEFLKGIDLFDIGQDIIQGLINGIKDMGGNLVGSIGGIVTNAVDSAKKKLGINSPSKVFMEIGQFTGAGLVKGLDRMDSKVARASERMANAAIVREYPGVRTPSPRDYQLAAQLSRGRAEAEAAGGATFNNSPTFVFNDANPKPSEIARKEKQTMRNWAASVNF